RARDLVLRRALPEAENVLRARRVDPESAEDHVLAEVNAVDEDGPEIEVAERSLHPLDELLARQRDEAATHRALARAARLHAIGQRLERAGVLPRGDADRHLLERASVQRVGARKLGPRVERDFITLAIDNASPAERDTTTAERELSARRACARRP